MWKAAPLAWCLPVISVFALLIYDPNLYLSQSDFCWMSLDAFYPAVMGPIVTIMLINFSLFLVVLKSVIAASKSNGLRSTQSSQLRTWYQFRMAICLFPNCIYLPILRLQLFARVRHFCVSCSA